MNCASCEKTLRLSFKPAMHVPKAGEFKKAYIPYPIEFICGQCNAEWQLRRLGRVFGTDLYKLSHRGEKELSTIGMTIKCARDIEDRTML